MPTQCHIVIPHLPASSQLTQLIPRNTLGHILTCSVLGYTEVAGRTNHLTFQKENNIFAIKCVGEAVAVTLNCSVNTYIGLCVKIQSWDLILDSVTTSIDWNLHPEKVLY